MQLTATVLAIGFSYSVQQAAKQTDTEVQMTLDAVQSVSDLASPEKLHRFVLYLRS